MAIGAVREHRRRLQQQADPGEIVVGPASHEATDQRRRVRGPGRVVAARAWARLGLAVCRLQVRGRGAGRPLRRPRGRVEGVWPKRQTGRQVVCPSSRSSWATRVSARAVSLARRSKRDARLNPVRVIEARCRPAGEEGANTPLRQLLEADIPGRHAGLRAPAIERSPRRGWRGPCSRAHPAQRRHRGERRAGRRSPATSSAKRSSEAWRRYLVALAAEHLLIIADRGSSTGPIPCWSACSTTSAPRHKRPSWSSPPHDRSSWGAPISGPAEN